MFSDLLCEWINSSLSSYLEGVSKDQANFSLLKGKLELSHVQLYKYALLQHNLPLVIDRGVISSIEINVPVKSLTDIFATVNVQDITIVCHPLILATDKYLPKEDLPKIREHQMHAHEYFKKTFNSLISKSSLNLYKGIIRSFLRNVKINVSNIHIRVEIENNDFVDILGVKIENLQVGDLANNPKPNSIIRSIKIDGLSVYYELHQERVTINNVERFKNEMALLAEMDHKYIIESVSLSGQVQINDGIDKFDLDIDLPELVANIGLYHINLFLRVLEDYPKFLLYWRCRTIARPDPENLQDCWRFVNKCAFKSHTSERNVSSNVRELCKSFFEYRKAQKAKNLNEIARIEHTLPVRIALLYRDLSISKPKKMKQYEDVFVKVESDLQLILSSLIRMLSIKCTAKALALRLTHDTLPSAIEFKICNGTIAWIYKNRSFILQALFNDIIMSMIDKDTKTQLMNSKDQTGFTFTTTLKVLDSYNILLKNKSTLDIEFNANLYEVDLSKLNVQKFDPIILQYLKMMINIIGSPFFPLDFNNISIRSCPAEFKIKLTDDISAVLSYKVFTFIKRKFNLYKASISLKYKDTRFDLINDVSVTGTLHHSKCPIDITPVQFRFDWELLPIIVKLVSSFDWVIGVVEAVVPQLPSILPHYKFEFKLPSITMNVFFNGNYCYDILLNDISGRIMTREGIIHLFTKSLIITDYLRVNKIAISITSDFKATLSAEFVKVRIFHLMTLMPKDFFQGFSLVVPLPTIGLYVNQLMIDFSFGKINVIYLCHQMKGEIIDSKIYFSGTSQLMINNTDFLNSAQLESASLYFNRKVKLDIHFDKVYPVITNDLVNDFLMYRVPMEMFPRDFEINLSVYINNLIAFENFFIQDILLDFHNRENELIGLLTLKKIEMPYVIVYNKPEDILLTLDICHGIYKAKLDNIEAFVDPSKFIKIINQIAGLEFRIPEDITGEAILNNFKLHLRLPEDEITCQFSMEGSIKMDKFIVTAAMRDLILSLDKMDIVEIPIAEVSTDNDIKCLTKTVNVDCSLWQLLRLIQLATADLLPTIKIPNIVFNDYGRKLAIHTESTTIYLRTQASMNYGPFALKVSLKDTVLDIYNFVVSTGFNCLAAVSPFEYQDSISGKFTGSIDILHNILNIKLDDGLKAVISPMHIAAMASLVDTNHIVPPFLRISNECAFDVTINDKFFVPRNSSFFLRVSGFIDRITVTTEDKRSLTVETRTLSNVFRCFAFNDKMNSTIAMCIEGSILKLSSRYILCNNTSIVIRYILGGFKIFQISPMDISCLPPEYKMNSVAMQTAGLKRITKKVGDVTYVEFESKIFPPNDLLDDGKSIPFHVVTPPPVGKKLAFTGKVSCKLGETTLVINDGLLREICRVKTDLTLDIAINDGKIDVNLKVNNFSIESRVRTILQGASSPILDLNAVLTEPPNIEDLNIVIGDCVVSLDVSVLATIYREYLMRNNFLNDIEKRAPARSVTIQINTPIVDRSYSPLSKIMMQNSYVTFTPADPIDIIGIIEMLNIQHISISAGDMSVKCVNKRETVMHPLLSIIPSFGRLTMNLKGKPVIETDDIWAPFKNTDFNMLKPLVMQFLKDSECFGSINTVLERYPITFDMNFATKFVTYIKISIAILHNMISYFSSVGHSICGGEQLPENAETLEIINWWVTSFYYSIVSAFTEIKQAVRGLPKKFVENFLIIIISLFQISLVIPDFFLVIVDILQRLVS